LDPELSILFHRLTDKERKEYFSQRLSRRLLGPFDNRVFPNAQSTSSSPTSISASEFPPAPFPAAQLQGLVNLSCGACKNILLENNSNSGNQDGRGPIQRVVDLPFQSTAKNLSIAGCATRGKLGCKDRTSFSRRHLSPDEDAQAIDVGL
ncbi:hypothetical protein BGZ65_003784, partial [Modicella reniformis]